MHSKPTCIIKHVNDNNCVFLRVFVTFINILLGINPIAGDTIKYKPVFVILFLRYTI